MDCRIPNAKHGARPRHQEAPPSFTRLRRRLSLQEDRPPPHDPVRNCRRIGHRNDAPDIGTDRRNGSKRGGRDQRLVESGVLCGGGGVYGQVFVGKPRQARGVFRGGEEGVEGQDWYYGEVREVRVGFGRVDSVEGRFGVGALGGQYGEEVDEDEYEDRGSACT